MSVESFFFIIFYSEIIQLVLRDDVFPPVVSPFAVPPLEALVLTPADIDQVARSERLSAEPSKAGSR